MRSPRHDVLVRDGSPVLIDLGQAMLLRHPRSPALLERDCRNMARYFGRLGVETSPGEVRERLVSGLDLEGDGEEDGGRSSTPDR